MAALTSTRAVRRVLRVGVALVELAVRAPLPAGPRAEALPSAPEAYGGSPHMLAAVVGIAHVIPSLWWFG